MEKIGGNSMLSSEQRLSKAVVSALSPWPRGWPGGWPGSQKPLGAAVILHHKARGGSRQMLLTLILLFLNKPKGGNDKPLSLQLAGLQTGCMWFP